MTGQAVDEAGKESWSHIERTIEQFLDSDVYLLTVPMWNLGIPYVLKYYIDAIVQPGYLFRYNTDGSVEGLARGKKMIVVISSGSDYTSDRCARLLESYLRDSASWASTTSGLPRQAMDVSPDTRKSGQRSAIAEARVRPQRRGDPTTLLRRRWSDARVHVA
jgi:FMN-dependent NADH-azoreductase